MSLCYDFQKWTIVTLGLIGISLSIGLLMQVNGQTVNLTCQGAAECSKMLQENEKELNRIITFQNQDQETNNNNNKTRTFEGCYSNLAFGVLFASAFSPGNGSLITALMDPKVKNWMSNYCIYYHNQTGIWMHIWDKDKDEDVIDRFFTNNPMPESLTSVLKRK